MTLDELNAHRDGLVELAKLREILDRLRDKAHPGAQRIDGMPHGSGVGDPTGQLAAEIADLSAVIDAKEQALRSSGQAVARFCDSIPDARTRLVFRLRFVRGLTWKEVADHLGKYMSEWSAANICYTYLDELRAENYQKQSKGIKSYQT